MATNDLSQLTTLEALTKNAESRTPVPSPAPLTSGSGLIDIMEIDRKSRESSKPPSQVVASPVVPPPLPSSQAAMVSISDSDVYTTMASSRRKRRAIGAIGGAVALLGITAAVILSWSGPKPAPAPIGETQSAAPPATMTAAATPAPAPAPPPAETVAAAPPSTAPAAATTTAGKPHGKGRRGPGHAAPKGPKLTKVTSSGTGAH